MNDNTPVIAPLLAESAHALLRGRRSVRYYRQETPPRVVLDRIVQSAAMAPSAHNRQPWRYLIVTDAAVKERLARTMGARLAEDRRRDGDATDAIKTDVARSFKRMTGAPVVVLVAMTVADMDHYPDEARRRAEYLMAVQSTAMSTQNLLLAAHAEGLGTCWMCAPLFCPDEVRTALGMPAHWQPQGLLTLGYPERLGKLKPRRPQADFVAFAPGEEPRDQ